ncbi:MAG: WbqC family protein [Microscillaceae bacterium]|nr:WbqC family protein [Microscillaceae bacterium]MDW8461257.1 WbqC family protein [Cytophagales bacterium]
MTIITELHYLPTIPYFKQLKSAEVIYLNLHEFYLKQTLRNRTFILTANGIQSLSVPILKHTSKGLTKEVAIDYSQKWLNVHWRAIQSAYGKAPFFEYLADEFQQVYRQRPAFLADLNLQLLTICLKCLGWQKNIYISQAPLAELQLQKEAYRDLSNTITVRTLRELNSQKDIKAYKQIFGKPFVPNLSVIDLLFCQGLQSLQYL